MYEQLSLFDSEPKNLYLYCTKMCKKKKPQKETLFEQILSVVKNPLIPCVNCLCQYCTHNVEELYNTVKLEEVADEPCFICDECREYTGESNHTVCRKMNCKNFIMSDYGAKRNRKRFKLIT